MPAASHIKRVLTVALTTAALAACEFGAQTPQARGEYLTTVMVCGDCHTPGFFFGKPDRTASSRAATSASSSPASAISTAAI